MRTSWRTSAAVLGGYGMAVAALVMVITLCFQIRDRLVGVGQEVQQVRQGVEGVQQDLRRAEFKITFPLDGAEAERSGVVRGTGGYTDRNTYIIVQPEKEPSYWVQDARASVGPGGFWGGTARYGEEGAGKGERYIVMAVATKSTLSPGELKTGLPRDATLTPPVVVLRTR